MNRFRVVLILGAGLALTACVNVKKSDSGDNVDVKTPFGSVSVRTDQVKPEDTGLNVYPGATLIPKHSAGHDEDKANVNISSPWGQLKVVALSYRTDDAPEKVLAWYRKDLQQKYGKLLECKGGNVSFREGKGDSNELTCESDKSDKDIDFSKDTGTVELKTGSKDKQHIVAVKPEGDGSKISLVYVQKHGEKDSI